MIVPKNEGSNVAQRPMTGVFQNFNTSPAEFGGAEAGAIQQVGGQLDQLSQTMAKIKDEDDATFARSIDIEAQSAMNASLFGDEGYYSLNGEVAYSGLTEAIRGQNKIKKEFVAKGKNSNQKRMLNDIFDARIKTNTDAMSRYALKERKTWQMSVEAATVESNLNNAVANIGNNDLIAQERNSAFASIDRIVSMQGGGDEARKLARDKWESELHALNVDRLMTNSPFEAKEYYNQNSESILPLERITLEKRLQGVVDLAEAQSFTDQAISNNPYDLTAQRKEAAKIKNPEVRKLTESLISIKSRERDQEQSINEKRINREAWRELEALQVQGASSDAMVAVASKIEDTSMRHSMLAWVNDVKSAQGVVTDIQTKGELSKLAVTAPDDFKNLDLTKYKHLLSRRDLDKLVSMQVEILKGGKLSYQRSVKQLSDDSLRAIGIDTTPKEGSKDAKYIYKFRDALESELEAERTINGGREVSYEDTKKIIDRLLIRGEVRGLLWDTDTYLFESLPGDVFYVDDISDLPVSEIREIRETLNSKGLPSNDQDVIDLFNSVRGN